MRQYFLFYIQMQESKENQLGNFGKLLRKLEMENVGLPELRQLKQEHTYLEKLRQQRTKIEELKGKYDHAEAQLNHYQDENQSQRRLIQQQHRTLQLLQEKLADSQKKRMQLQGSLGRAIESEREKHRQKNTDLLLQLDQMKKQCKSKDILIFQMEDQIQRKTAQLKEQIQAERKKMTFQWEQKAKCLVAERGAREQDIEELRELVTRQHKALQMQNEQYEELNHKNQQLSQGINDLEDQLNEAVRVRAELEDRVSDLTELAGRMEGQLEERRAGASAKEQVEQLRKKVSQLAKGELQRIEFIVNEFE